MPTIRISIHGTPEIRQKLLRLGIGITDLSMAMREIGQGFMDWYGSVPFATEGEIYGKPWTELSRSTLTEKARRFPGRGILVASGKMQRSFKVQSSSSFMRLYNNSPYFGYHQTGTKHMPQRLELTLTQERIKVAAGIIERDIKAKIQMAGL